MTAAADSGDSQENAQTPHAPIGVVGPGRMGVGIATAVLLAEKGHQVRLLDLKERAVEDEWVALVRAREEIAANLVLLRDLGLVGTDSVSLMERLTIHRDPESVGGCAIVFEALPERVEAKRTFYQLADEHLDSEGVVASATSSFDLGLLRTLSVRPERIVTAHWLNPAFLIPLVEVARADWTSATAVESVIRFLEDIGKMPVPLRDSPGFIVPRIQTVAMNEAVRILEEGVASAEDIDTAIKAGFGFRLAVLGLIEFIDLGGVDILAHAGGYLHERLGGAHYEPPPSVKSKMASGDVGPRSGRGYYDYDGVDTAALFSRRYRAFAELLHLFAESSDLSFHGGVETQNEQQ